MLNYCPDVQFSVGKSIIIPCWPAPGSKIVGSPSCPCIGAICSAFPQREDSFSVYLNDTTLDGSKPISATAMQPLHVDVQAMPSTTAESHVSSWFALSRFVGRLLVISHRFTWEYMPLQPAVIGIDTTEQRQQWQCRHMCTIALKPKCLEMGNLTKHLAITS